MRERPSLSGRATRGGKNNNTSGYRSRHRSDGKTDSTRSKVVIRHLPATVTEDSLKDALGQEWLVKIDWLRFIPGVEGKAFMGEGRAYVRLKDSRDIYSLKDFIEKTRHDHNYFGASKVSFAPCQRVRSDVGKVNHVEGTLEDYEDFKTFCASMERHNDDTSARVTNIMIPSNADKVVNENVNTALMAFLEKQHKGKKKGRTQAPVKGARHDVQQRAGATNHRSGQKKDSQSVKEKSVKKETKAKNKNKKKEKKVAVKSTAKKNADNSAVVAAGDRNTQSSSETKTKAKITHVTKRAEDNKGSEKKKGVRTPHNGTGQEDHTARGRGRGRGGGNKHVTILKKDSDARKTQ